MEGTSVGLGDAMLLAQNGGGMNGANGSWFVWILVLFLLLGGNGWNRQQGDYATQAQVYASNDQQTLMGEIRNLNNGINRLGNGIADATYALNNTMTNGFASAQRDILQGNFGIQQDILGGVNGVQRDIMAIGNNLGQAINENRFTAQNCCCETNRNIDSVRYDAALNTSNINSTATANTQKILDKLAAMEANAKDAEIANLRQQLSAVNLAASQQAQNATIIQAVRPYPAPAYVVSSPYGSNTTCPYANA